jgi:transcriptional regulator with XRE-family HTH domain
MTLGRRIKEAREKAGLDQFEMVSLLRETHPTLHRITPGLLSQWENGKVERISFHAVDAIAAITQQPLEFFSELSGERRGDDGVDPPHHDDARDGSAAVLGAVSQHRRERAGQSKRPARD